MFNKETSLSSDLIIISAELPRFWNLSIQLSYNIHSFLRFLAFSPSLSHTDYVQLLTYR